ncbi:MAG: SRPBCC family protein [Fimbriimonadaceae bacterium]
MVTKTFETWIDAPVEDLWAFHSSAEALVVLTPPGRKVELVGEDLAVRNGAEHRIRVRVGPFPVEWRARISEVEPPRKFVDTAEKSPFAYWRHVHEFLADGDRTLLRDTVTYIPPMGLIGWVANALFISRDIDRMFAHRHRVTKEEAEKRARDRMRT